jgi:predicted glycosyltransferase
LNTPLKILLAPLDWGLGHTTRCIPIIRYLLEKDCVVTVAAEGASALLVRSNFPDLSILPIDGYNVRYSRHAGTFALKILAQVPAIWLSVRREKRWLEKLHRQYQFDLVISDNRYGLKIEGLPSVILTHQLQIRSGAGNLVNDLLRRAHYRILEQFDQCWVVDHQGENNIGGILSHPAQLPVNARYVGLLSQLTPGSQEVEPGRILVLLSGPEPQRSLLEQKILSQVKDNAPYRYTIVGGNPGGSVPENLASGVEYHTHLNAFALHQYIASAELVVCRSGYSTLMDLAFMGKKALLIPTPGQPEQEYLADNLSEKKLFLSRAQATLDLHHDAALALEFPGFSRLKTQFPHQKMQEAVDDILRKFSGLHLIPLKVSH